MQIPDPLLLGRVAAGERQQRPLHGFLVAVDLARGEAHDQPVGRLPIRPCPGATHEKRVVPIARRCQYFRMPCHFMCLSNVESSGSRQQSGNKKARDLAATGLWKRGRIVLRLIPPGLCPARHARNVAVFAECRRGRAIAQDRDAHRALRGDSRSSGGIRPLQLSWAVGYGRH
jgi:hypothetical protein